MAGPAGQPRHRGQEGCDVFLSHRGPETKRNFSIWLKNELENQNIRTFFDDRSLQAGDSAASSMENAMHTVEWGIIVLSPGFFASGYCMKELKVFLDRGRAILIGFNLTVADCNADLIVERASGTIWEQHGGRLWESCSTNGEPWSEEDWRKVRGRVKGTTILEFEKVDGYWDRCISEAVRIAGEKLGRPVFLKDQSRVDTTPFLRNMDFLGRDDELARVKAGLAKNLGRVCVTGLGGVGKTQLVLEYVHEHRREYANIFWIDADSRSLKTGYLALAHHLCIQPAHNMGENARPESLLPSISSDCGKEKIGVAQIREALERSQGPCLLVLDNVDNQQTLTRFLPRRGPCHVIVTTRLRAMANFGLVELDVLKKEDGLRLLAGGMRPEEQIEEHLSELAERFGYLTLALAVSARLFAEGRSSPSDLIKRLKAKGPCVFERELVDPSFAKHPDIVNLFQASLDMLAADARATQEEKELARNLIWVAGWFASAPIRMEVLGLAGLISLGAARKSEDSFHEQMQEAVGLLRFYGLATLTTEGGVVFHTLVQSFGKWGGSRETGVAMLQALIRAGQPKRDVEHFENAVEKAIPLHGAARAEIPLAEDMSVLGLVERIGLQLSFHHISLSFQPSRALEVIERCEHMLRLRTKEVSEGGAIWGKVFGLKALVQQAIGEYKEAERLFRLALEFRQKELGPGHPDTVLTLNNLAALLKSQARFDEAERLCRRALLVYEKLGLEGSAHWQLGMTNCLNNLAGLLEMQGNHKEAKPLYMRALKIQEEQLGPKAGLATATTLDNLAGLLVGHKQYGEAEAFYRRALKLRGEELGDSHPDTARSLHNLAVLLSIRGEYGEAESLHWLALKIREEKLGHEHPDTLMSVENLVRLLKFLGKSFNQVKPKQVLNVGAREEPATTATTPGYFIASSEAGTFLYNDRLAVPQVHKNKPSVPSLLYRRSNPNTFFYQSGCGGSRGSYFDRRTELFEAVMQLKTRLLEVSKDLVASGGGGKAGELLPVVGAPPGLFVNEHHEVRQASGPMKRDIMRPVPYAFPRKQIESLSLGGLWKKEQEERFRMI